ncbi:MAG TPA: hypothetical protein VF665_17560 [Longimicrobium sp.]|jgi:hypothetical protein
MAEALASSGPLRRMLAEVIEDCALKAAIQEGCGTERVSRDDVFGALNGR